MEEAMPAAFAELAQVFDLLEKHYRDMQDIEFTVERGKLWMLQTRSGKRTAKAALTMAVDMVGEGLIDERTAILRVDPMPLDQFLDGKSVVEGRRGEGRVEQRGGGSN